MNLLNKKKKILEFIKTRKIGVLATIAPNGKPEAAVVEFAETDKLELIFNTFISYRKYKNLKHNRNVAFVIGWKDITIQYEGIAHEVKGKELDKCIKLHIEKIPHKTKFHEMPNIIYFKVKPKWIRYSDFSKRPWEIVEVKFS